MSIQYVKGTAIYDEDGALINFIADNQAGQQQAPQGRTAGAGDKGDQQPQELSGNANLDHLKRVISSIIKDNAFTRCTSGYRSGKLDPTKYRRLLTNNTKVFARKNKAGAKKYHMSILLDVSGSMDDPFPPDWHTTRYELAGNMTLAVSRVLESIGVPTEIVIFSTIARTLKKYSDKTPSRLNIENGDRGGTNLLYGIEQINTIPEHLTLIISDGETNDPSGVRLRLHKTNTETMGVAISNTNSFMKPIVSNCRSASTAQEFEGALVAQLKSVFHRG